MQWGSRIEGVRRALQELVTRLNPEDRLSLVSFNQAAHVLVEDLSPRDAKQFLAAVDSLSAEGSTDVGSGLREAFGLAQQMAGPDRLPVRVILLTDGLLELDRPWAERIERQVSEAAARGTPLYVIDMGQQRQGGADLAALAQLGHGTIHRATGFDQIRWALRELVTGHSQLVAHDARLQVTFNPKTVLEYRLLGHEAKDWAGMMPGPLQADFRNGQSATAVYEVRLAPAGPNVPNDVAAAELTWSRPGEKNGEKGSQKATARLERKDVAVSLAAAPLWLQEAAVVAETAEALGRSPFLLLRTPHGSMTKALVRANELAGLVDSRVKQRPSFNDLIGLIQQSIKAKPSRSGGRKS
jgi:Ca-activated chloride channel family protein